MLRFSQVTRPRIPAAARPPRNRHADGCDWPAPVSIHIRFERASRWARTPARLRDLKEAHA